MGALDGKVAIVTGAGRGIGRGEALLLASEGAKVVVNDLGGAREGEGADKTPAQEVADEIVAGGGDAVANYDDVASWPGAEGLVGQAIDVFGRLDILVNNAGAIRGGDFLKIPDEQWAGDWSLKILGYVRMARAVFPIMQAQGGGRIVNVVGAAARNPTPGYLPGGIANSGLINFSKGLADLGAPSNILVTAVSPAATATARWEGLIAQQAAAAGKTVEAQRAEAASHYPLKRIATPEDIADLVCFLVSARASFITGVCITVDGGATRGVYL